MEPQCKILVIDDEPINTLMLEEALALVGVIHSCNDSEKALDLIRDIEPDILLLDLEMPNVSGFDILRLIKELPKFSDIRTIVITSHSDPAIEEEALSLGAIDFISNL